MGVRETARELLCAPYAIRADGTVFSADGGDLGWTGVKKISGDLALRWDGRVLTRGRWEQRTEAIARWRDVKDVCACGPIEAALLESGELTWVRSDTVGHLTYGHCDLGWTDVERFFVIRDPYDREKSYADYAVGFRADGTVRAAFLDGGDDRSREIEGVLNALGGIKKLSLDCRVLTETGAVVCFATRNGGKTEKGVFADFDHPAEDGAVMAAEGCVLLEDGTVRLPEEEYPTASSPQWRDILAISGCYLPVETGRHVLMALRADGQVLMAEKYGHELADASGWKLFDTLDTLPQELDRAKARCLAEGERLDAREAESTRLGEVKRLTEERLYVKLALERQQKELARTKGLFSGGKRKALEEEITSLQSRLTQLDTALKQYE